ncbi:MAG: ATP-dependent helicase HrpB [Sulfurovum sp.]|jgi:ATP-dependent helicase HrpB|uniref:ATP-dependent helicase HrpB n=1 Tax=Sulfurovum sp. TaxID=1969726 RepID=UPI003C769CB6
MQTLPINQVIPEVKQKLHQHQSVVLQAPPGSGKTTVLPLELLNEPWLKDKKVIMLEPRRLAVRTSAQRMAELLGEKVGKRIGYQIKMESVQSHETQILIVTEGILTRKLQQDPSLEDIALIIFDEFHERSLHADLSLALSLESQAILREDLKILIMSATLNTSAISKLLDNAPVIQSEGRTFPVERIYLPTDTVAPTKKELPVFVHRLLHKIIQEEEGNILVFLSGVKEIKAVEKYLNSSKPKDMYISTLYGNLNKEDQDRAIQSPPEGFRKVVLSTNIAQTSLTIEGIKIVVDAGLQNVSVFNPFSGMNKLESSFISEDSATQRAGRAGRLSEGKAYHLWHRSKILLQHDVPEILSADLSQMLLELALWGNDSMETLSWMDIPPASYIAHATKLLHQLGALDIKGDITAHGRAMSRFGLHPRLAHMMLKAQALDLGYEASLLAVLITEKEIYHNAFGSSDIRERVRVLHDVRQNNRVNPQYINLKQCHYLLKNAKRIEKIQKETINEEMLAVLLAFAYPDRIAKQRHENLNVYLLSNGKSASLHKTDELFHSRFLVISDLDARTKDATIYKAIEITQAQIEEHLSDQIHQHDDVSWDDEQQRVKVRRIKSFGAIPLRETQIMNASNEEVLDVLIEALEELGLEQLYWSKEAQILRQRVNFLNQHNMAFPDFSDAYLLDHLDVWLAPYLNGLSSLRACQNLDFHNILLGQMSFEQTQTLDDLAPTKLKVASGSHIAIDYSDSDQPILAVRLQEMFGTKSTPCVLGGKVKLMIHLLSPASRPMQVTQDLESFWTNTYGEVKKELRGKYKKHYWPDDPLTAVATSKTKKHM